MKKRSGKMRLAIDPDHRSGCLPGLPFFLPTICVGKRTRAAPT